MVTATNPTALAPADRLIALYRREETHWTATEMLGLEQQFFPRRGMERTAKRIAATLGLPPVSADTIEQLAESAIREMVQRGHASVVERFIESQTTDRFRASNDWGLIGGPDRDDVRDLFVARALDLKESDPEAFAALRHFGESLALASSLKDRKPMKRQPARAAGSRGVERAEKGAA